MVISAYEDPKPQLLFEVEFYYQDFDVGPEDGLAKDRSALPSSRREHRVERCDFVASSDRPVSIERTLMTEGALPHPVDLLNRAQSGEADSIGPLLEHFRGYLRLLARLEISRRLQGKVDASDVVQEVFLQASRSFPEFRGATEAELVAWLRTILVTRLANIYRRYYRTQRRDIRLERDLGAALDRSSQAMAEGLVSPESTPSSKAVRRERAVLLADAITNLQADHREVIILHHLEELTLPEVARRMERTVGSVEKLWIKALSHLRRSLGAEP